MISKENPFLERAGVQEPVFLAELDKAPEQPLGPEQQERVKTFARDLFAGTFEDVEVDLPEKLDLAEVETIPHAGAVQTFALDYFQTAEANADAKLLGLQTDTDVQNYLSDIFTVNATVPDKTRKEIAARSIRWRDSQLQQRLLTTSADQDAQFADMQTLTVNYKPQLLLKKFNALQKYRHFFKEVRKHLDAAEGSEQSAKLSIAKMYGDKVTELIAGLYSSVISVAEQLDEHPELSQYDEIGRQLEQAAPVLVDIMLQNETVEDFEAAVDRLERRLDYVRNGAAMDENGLTPIAPQLLELINKNGHVSAEVTASPLPPEVLETMRQTVWGASQTKALIDSVLWRLGVASTIESSWQEVGERQGAAEDDKYQVIIDPTKQKSLSVNTLKKVVYIGAQFSRGLIDSYPAGVLPGAAHELLHVLQGLVDEEISETIPLATIKGRRYLAVREGGGIANEQAMHQRYFGQNRGPNAYYAIALQAKLAGKNRLEVARAFYEALAADNNVDNLPEPEKTQRLSKLAETAVDRSGRLYRHHGHNSQPLNYIEQELFAAGLGKLNPEDKNKLLLRLGSFNVKDVATLHHFGLYPEGTLFDTIDLPALVLETYLQEFAKNKIDSIE